MWHRGHVTVFSECTTILGYWVELFWRSVVSTYKLHLGLGSARFRSELLTRYGKHEQTAYPAEPRSMELGNFFKDGPTPASFSFIFIFSYRKLVISRIRSRIAGVESEDPDHKTTTTVLRPEMTVKMGYFCSTQQQKFISFISFAKFCTLLANLLALSKIFANGWREF